MAVHGTTLITNALIERKGAVTGLVTTQGFRDVLEIAQGDALRHLRSPDRAPGAARAAPPAPRGRRARGGGRRGPRAARRRASSTQSRRRSRPRRRGRRRRLPALLSQPSARAGRRRLAAEHLPGVARLALVARSRRRSASTSARPPRPPTPTCSRSRRRTCARSATSCGDAGFAAAPLPDALQRRHHHARDGARIPGAPRRVRPRRRRAGGGLLRPTASATDDLVASTWAARPRRCA